MGEVHTQELVGLVWGQQSIWSQTADRLKSRLDRLRSVMLGLAVTSAVLTTLAAEVVSWNHAAGRVLALAAGLSVGLVPVVRVRLGRDAVSRWTRARAVSEELKGEVYRFLAGAAPFRGADRFTVLRQQARAAEAAADDLLADTAGVLPAQRTLPPVHDTASYVEARLVPQIAWYRDRAKGLAHRLGLARRFELALALTGVALGVLAAAMEVGWAAAWVAVVTTLTAALSSHVAAARWEYQLVEYLRTARELSRMYEDWVSQPPEGDEATDRFVARCEQVVSIQNEGWMAKWTAEPD